MTKQAAETKQAHEASKPAAPFSFPLISGKWPDIVLGNTDPLRRGQIQ